MIDQLNGTHLLLLDRWYITYHAPETLQRTQRRQTKYVTFRTYALPPEAAKAMNMWQGRMTEIGFASLADFNKGWVNIEEERKKITLPKGELRGGSRNETVTIPLNLQTGTFSGTKRVYVNAFDAFGQLTHWVQTATLTVP